MKRILCLALLACWSLAAAAGDEPSLCKSMCATEKQSCRQTVARKADADTGEWEDMLTSRRSMAKAARADLPTAATRAPLAAGAQHRRMEAAAACDAAHARCVRACAVPVSDVLTKQGRSKGTGPAASTHPAQ